MDWSENLKVMELGQMKFIMYKKKTIGLKLCIKSPQGKKLFSLDKCHSNFGFLKE